ncbi:response regulator [Peredibacter sp. HCB2-198]|uniref:response regulator n=1 Tax=Peredibacter sp. HCB2-198 TaxID=3383025 RepID=UPI0038B42AA2
MKIMIVDDEADIGFILGIELKRLGHEIQTFESAIAAKSYLEKEIPDAVLCDFQMPRMNGLELFMWLKEQGHQIPFYILTGEPSVDAKQLLSKGITDVLFKPEDLLRLSKIFK